MNSSNDLPSLARRSATREGGTVDRPSTVDPRPSTIDRRLIKRAVIVLAGVLLAAVPVSAQLFGVVFDPTNYGNALLRYAQLQQQYGQLVVTYQQITAQYQLMAHQAQQLSGDLTTRYRSLSKPWQLFTAEHT